MSGVLANYGLNIAEGTSTTNKAFSLLSTQRSQAVDTKCPIKYNFRWTRMVIPNDYNRRKMEARVNLFQTDSEQFS